MPFAPGGGAFGVSSGLGGGADAWESGGAFSCELFGQHRVKELRGPGSVLQILNPILVALKSST